MLLIVVGFVPLGYLLQRCVSSNFSSTWMMIFKKTVCKQLSGEIIELSTLTVTVRGVVNERLTRAFFGLISFSRTQ